ncbi:MAG: hypothetical protein WD049_00515 [Candidatus Paceibacterota bacterium]
MNSSPSPDHPNTFTKWWKSKPFLLTLAVFFAIGAIVVPLALSVYPPMPNDEVMESPEDKQSIERTPEIQQQ